MVPVFRAPTSVAVLSRLRAETRIEHEAIENLLAMAVEASRSVIDAAGHELANDWPLTPVWLDADAARRPQMFSNLLNNAAKYTLGRGRIFFTAIVEQSQVRGSVRDSGMGIPSNMLGQVFDMFIPINRTLDRAQGSLGIGLSLARQLVELHSGTIVASSDGIDQGSEFTVVLLLAASYAGQELSASVQAPLAPAVGRRVLVVDDNVDAAETMAMLLDLSGYETRTAFSGREAREIAGGYRPQLVFLDIGMREMHGFEVAERFRADAATASALLVALTGWGTGEDLRNTKVAGFDAHLIKPAEARDVEEILTRFLPMPHGIQA